MSVLFGALMVVNGEPTDGPSPACPECGTADALAIRYGYPTPDHIRSALRGEIALGGDVRGPMLPQFECRNESCGHTWGGSPAPGSSPAADAT